MKRFLPSGNEGMKVGKYMAWNFAFNVCSSINNVLSTHAIMASLSSAKDNSSGNITYNFIGREIVGQFGGIAISLLNNRKVNANPLKYGRSGVVIQQLATFVELLSPFIPERFFIPVVGAANIGKNIAWIRNGAINARCINEISKNRNNPSEVYTHISAINTCASTIGLMVGIQLTNYLPNHYARLLTCPVLTCIQLFTFSKALKSLGLASHVCKP